MVHASISMVPEAECVCWGVCCCCWGGGEADTLGGGGTALYLPYAMIEAEIREMVVSLRESSGVNSSSRYFHAKLSGHPAAELTMKQK